MKRESTKSKKKLKKMFQKRKEANSGKVYIMKFEDLKGKEIIDANGNKVGEVSDVEWNFESNKVVSLIATEGGVAKIGIGKKMTISYEDIKTIGEKILLKKTFKK